MPRKIALVISFLSVLLLTAIAPAGCGGGGGDTSGTPPGTIDPNTPVELQAKAALTSDDKVHFLRRTHFAYNPADLVKLNQLGMDAYLDQMLTLGATPQLEADALAATVLDPDFPSEAELTRWWLHMMVNNPNPFQEVLAMFWHDHFAASSQVLPAEARWWVYDHINLWRENGLASLPVLLHAMSVDWLMLEWLDGVRSTANAPNENFAREFWELFTLGADNGYTQDDIVQASRCFTGFRTQLVANRAGQGRDQLIVSFNAGRHNNTTKSIFGQTVPPNGVGEYMDVVNLTLAERPVAEFICYKVWVKFIHKNPTLTLIQKLAEKLRDSNYDMKELFRTVFKCNEFYSAQAKQGLIKTPVDHVIGFARATGLRITETRMDANLLAIGQRPSQPPTVNGWPDENAWLSAQGLLERVNFLRDTNFYKNEAPQAGIDVGTLIDPLLVTDGEVVDQIADRLKVTLTPAQRAEAVDYLNNDRLGNGTIVAQPWDFNDAVQRDKKIRGLLYILGQHPTYSIR